MDAGTETILTRAAEALEWEADYRRGKADQHRAVMDAFFNNPAGQSLNGQALDDESKAEYLEAVAGELRTQIERGD